MQKLSIVFTVVMALVLMGCPPPVSDNSASGDNAPAQNGDNPDSSAQGDPEPKAIVLPQVSAGDNHTMVLKSDGTLWTFGQNSGGQPGDGSVTNRLIPVEITVE